MKINVGSIDRYIRYMLTVVITIAGLYYKSWWGLIALVPLLTGYSLVCPLYKIFGLNTCGSKSVQ